MLIGCHKCCLDYIEPCWSLVFEISLALNLGIYDYHIIEKMYGPIEI